MITDKTPGWAEAAFGIFFFLTVAGLVAFLMTRGSGWHALAGKYPERVPYTGELRRCRTFQMVAADSDQSFGTRFSGGIIRVGATRDALCLVTLQLPWAFIASAKPFEAPGWVKPVVEAGTVFQAAYARSHLPLS